MEYNSSKVTSSPSLCVHGSGPAAEYHQSVRFILHAFEGNCLQYCNLNPCIFNFEVNQEPDGDLIDYVIQPQEIILWHTTFLPMPKFWEAL